MVMSKALRTTASLLTVAWSVHSGSVAGGLETLTESLEAAELAFAASVANKDFESFQALIDQQAIFVTNQALNGKAAILEAWSGFFAEDAPRLEWHPETVVVRPDGRLGISRGPYSLTLTGPDGRESIQRGQFMSVWERQPSGSWRILFDSGCPPCPDCSAQ